MLPLIISLMNNNNNNNNKLCWQCRLPCSLWRLQNDVCCVNQLSPSRRSRHWTMSVCAVSPRVGQDSGVDS